MTLGLQSPHTIVPTKLHLIFQSTVLHLVHPNILVCKDFHLCSDKQIGLTYF